MKIYLLVREAPNPNFVKYIFVNKKLELHSVNDRPSHIAITYDGKYVERKWCKDNILHRANGPAVVWISRDEDYFLNGISLEKEDWKQERLKYLK